VRRGGSSIADLQEQLRRQARELEEARAEQAAIAIENTCLLSELRQRTMDLTESLEQQTATSKLLDVISRSASDLEAVFETLAESTGRLCGADRGFVFRFDGQVLRMVAGFNASPGQKDFVARNPIRPGRHSAAARAALERRAIHVPDVLADPEYSYGAKNIERLRTVLAVPILKGDISLGVILIYRLKDVRPFTDKQIALVETFAAQAVIAIENARLLNELRQRTDELSAALEQYTATSDVLSVISSSPGELDPVFNAVIENALRVCDAECGVLYRYDGDRRFYPATWRGVPAAYAEVLRQRGSFRPKAGWVLDRLLQTGQIVHNADESLSQNPAATYGGRGRLLRYLCARKASWSVLS
jgi:two-component system, NtrC family, sensor kinase